MKKFIAAASSLGMALSMSVALPTPAHAAPDVTEYCKSIIQYYPGHTLGDCISSFHSNPNAWATKTCNFWSDEGLLDDFGFKNFGDCVRTLKAL